MAGKKSTGRRMKNLVSSAKRASGLSQAGPTSGPAGAMPVQVGRLTMTSKDVGRVRSGTGKVKGALTGDRLDEIATLLDSYHRAKDDAAREPILTELHDVCEWYLFDHTGVKEQAHRGEEKKVALVEDLFAEVRLELSRGQAQQAYLDDAYREERDVRADDGKGMTKSDKFALKHQTAGGAVKYATQKMIAGQGSSQKAAFDIMTKHGLSEAEVVAIRTFTAEDYRYINPATANSKSRMDGYMESWGRAESQRQGLVEEGTLHTGVAMQGLAKLPPMRGTLYRGAQLTPADFAKEYTVGNTVTFPSLTSSSTVRKVADGWAAKNAGEKTVHYVATLNVTNARDIQALSMIGDEKEWVLLPGAMFVVRAVKKMTKDLPDGHEWYEVELQQTK